MHLCLSSTFFKSFHVFFSRKETILRVLHCCCTQSLYAIGSFRNYMIYNNILFFFQGGSGSVVSSGSSHKFGSDEDMVSMALFGYSSIGPNSRYSQLVVDLLRPLYQQGGLMRVAKGDDPNLNPTLEIRLDQDPIQKILIRIGPSKKIRVRLCTSFCLSLNL